MVRYFLYSYNRSLRGRKREIINEKGRGEKGVQNKARKKKRKKRYPLANAIQNPDMQIYQRKSKWQKKKRRRGRNKRQVEEALQASRMIAMAKREAGQQHIHDGRQIERPADSKEVEKRNRQLSSPPGRKSKLSNHRRQTTPRQKPISSYHHVVKAHVRVMSLQSKTKG